MSTEKKLILEMLQNGKINVEEAEVLLENTEDASPIRKMVNTSNKKFLRVLVTEANDTKVNINLPIALAEIGLKLVPKDALNVDGQEINLKEILELIKEGNEGELANVETTDNGKEVKVKIFVE